MDFFTFKFTEAKGATDPQLSAGFSVGQYKDLMVRGKSFYAIWDEDRNIWSTNEYDVVRLVDTKLRDEAVNYNATHPRLSVKYLRDFDSNGWVKFRKLLAHLSDTSVQLDSKLTWTNTEVKKTDYISKSLPYALVEGDYSAWDELVGTLYNEEERAKIEWAIGAIVSGDSKEIQKFMVFYGSGGTGKSTVMNIIQSLFAGYVAMFEAKALVGSNNSFAMEPFKMNPLVAIQHDGDLSRIDDNSKLNSIVAHEDMVINEKNKAMYTARINAFLFMGTNKPVKITDSKSGLLRRLIDVKPTGVRIPPARYEKLMSQVEFQLGAIASHCLKVYKDLGRNYYNGYQPKSMMQETNVFFNFIEDNYDVFAEEEGITLKRAYSLYKQYADDAGIEYTQPMYKFKAELKSYYDEFNDEKIIDGSRYRSYYSGFKKDLFEIQEEAVETLVLNETTSLLDELLADAPAQEASKDGFPKARWANIKTTLREINTKELHYVKVPTNHIVIDFDLRGDDGGKDLARNLDEALKWPATYGELSKSGAGVHLHYLYTGDVSELDSHYSEGIEVKVYRGDSALRRKLTKCNSLPIATLTGGLPLKEKKVINAQQMQSEKGLRDLIGRNLRKEIHPGTKPSIDFISKILDDAYASGMAYDVTDLRTKIMAFANNSSNQPLLALKAVQKMKFKSEERLEETPVAVKDDRLVFFDVEVYPNLFVVCWKFRGKDSAVVRMINPTPKEIEAIFALKLVGFNNRRYDNHMLWARYLGYDNQKLYELSKKIIEGEGNTSMFGEAYNLSHTDIYDFSSKKQGLKKFQVELGILHMELDIPWDQPVPEELWPKVVEYCCNDVVSTEEVFESRIADYNARLVLAALSGLSPNDTTQKHTAKIIFGNDRTPQKSFIYTDLSEMFPGYVYDKGKSTYRGEIVGEGGYVYAEPGMYQNVALLDVASMHPTSIEQLSAFGQYTENFAALKAARMAIKHKEFETAGRLLGGALKPFLTDPSTADDLSYALKIIINIVYGLTSASFPNAFRDPRNKDNIVAKRGALFMIDLKHAVQELGFTVAHIKTDSIKIPDATPEIIQFVMDFGKKYGYDFEHEGTYDQFCLVNDAVYIARQDKESGTKWTAVGAQFQHPYVFKTLFTGKDVTIDDLCEAKSVSKGTMYLDFGVEKPMALADGNMKFVGRTGLFIPVKEGGNGGTLYRVFDDKFYAVAGTKGHLWLEADVAKTLDPEEIDLSYFEALAKKAQEDIDFFGPFAHFVANQKENS